MKKLLLLAAIATFALVSCSKKTGTGLTSGDKELIVEITTEFGKMYAWLYKDTPLHRKNFLKLADSGFYNNTTFHRVVTNFVIQGGDPNSKDNDPTNDGQGGPGYLIPAEILPHHKHVYGALAAARMGDNVNPARSSSGSQFYIVVSKNGTSFLDGSYTVFGHIFSGMNVAETIVAQPKGPGDRPQKDIKMQVKVIKKSVKQLQKQFNFTPPD